MTARLAAEQPRKRGRMWWKYLLLVLACAALRLNALCCLFVPWKGMTLDYWVWLGCPLPFQMMVLDGYPGHGLTEQLRHEEYYESIPYCGMSYAWMMERFGEPEGTREYDNPYNADCVWMEAAYAGFTVHLTGFADEPAEERQVVYTVVTTPDIVFTHQKFKVGDSRASVEHATRYYTSHVPEDLLVSGFTWGYVDGSGLTMWTWVEFRFDETDHVTAILLHNPW